MMILKIQLIIINKVIRAELLKIVFQLLVLDNFKKCFHFLIYNSKFEFFSILPKNVIIAFGVPSWVEKYSKWPKKTLQENSRIQNCIFKNTK